MVFHNSTRIHRVRSLAYSIQDGFFYSLMVGFAETYFSAYALFLGANHFQMGLLSCLPPFLAGQSQFFTHSLQKKFPSRKKLVMIGVSTQAFSILPILLCFHLPQLKMEFYIFFVTLYFTANSLVAPVWNSWMGDLVSFARRGVYFGKRNKFVMVGTFLSMLLGGAMLWFAKKSEKALWGFTLLLAIGFLCRLISLRLLSFKLDVPLRHNPNFEKISFFKYCKELPQKNYGFLVISMVTVNFGVYLAAAFYTPHLLQHLKLDYWTYTILISCVLLFKSLASGFWGELIDKMGAKKIVVITSLLIAFTTWPWAFTSSIVLILVAQCYTGIAWAGYELSTFTFLLDTTTQEERSLVTSYFNILNTAAGFAGGLIGAVYVSQAHDSDLAFRFLFVATALIRLGSFLIFTPYLKDTRILEPVKTKDVLLKATGFKSTLGLTSRLLVLPPRRRKDKVEFEN